MREAKFKKQLTVALPEEIYNRIKVITDQRKISMGSWIREMSEEALGKTKLISKARIKG